MTATARAPATGGRNPMLAKVHLAAKELGLQEEARRDVLERVTGQRSARDLSDAQLHQVLEEFKRLGWKAAQARGRPQAKAGATPGSRHSDHPTSRKARALWLSLWQLGAVANPAEEALEAFAARQLKCTKMQWADQALAYKLIEALKAMAVRAGWDAAGDDLVEVKRRLVVAQWVKIAELTCMAHAGPPVCMGLAGWAHGQWITPAHKAHTSWTEAEIDAAIAKLGQWIRKVMARTGEAPES